MDLMEKIEDKEKYFYRHMDTVKVKGKNKAVRILEIFNGNSQRIIDLKLSTKALFEEGIRLYFAQETEKALANFNQVLEKDPKDKAAEKYIERCRFLLKNGIEKDWDGVEKLDVK